MNLTSDQQIFWQHGFIKLNGTIVTTWAMMLVMALGSKLVTRKLVSEGNISRWQGSLEIVVTTIEKQIQEVGINQPGKFSPSLARSFCSSRRAASASLSPVISLPRVHSPPRPRWRFVCSLPYRSSALGNKDS